MDTTCPNINLWLLVIGVSVKESGNAEYYDEKFISYLKDRHNLHIDSNCRLINGLCRIFPYFKYLGDLLKEKDWEKLNNFIYKDNCVRSFNTLTNRETRYGAFLEMLEAIAVGNITTLELLLPDKIENVVNIFPLYS